MAVFAHQPHQAASAGEFLVHGVRPITQAVSQGWTISALLHDGRTNPSAWAKELLESVPATSRIAS